jgi:very-short-patch-repair endonuclease
LFLALLVPDASNRSIHWRFWCQTCQSTPLTGWIGKIHRSPHPANVGRTPSIPPELTQRPFSLAEARDAGLTLSALSSKAWKRIGAELYRWTELPEDPWLTLSAWRRVLPRETVFVGASAAWLHGLDLGPTDPVEVAVPTSSGLRSRAGLVVRRWEIPPSEVVSIRHLRATTLPRTLAELCISRPSVEALVAIDMAVKKGHVDSRVLSQYAEKNKGRRGAARLRSLALLAAPAESPMETRLRWILIQAGLPRPEVQTKLGDADRFVGRVDLYYPKARLVLEYDGGNHRERLVDDDRRQNLLANAGYRLLRFTAPDVYQHPDVTVAQVQAALASRTRLVPDVSNR